jgi:hypothetical protein
MDESRQDNAEQADVTAHRLLHEPTRRTFLTRAARKAVYAAPVVVVLGMNAEARANSKDGIRWSQCGSQGESCGTGACCPGFMCVAAVGNPHCEPDM